ncbi:hypothetical protein ACF07T_29220 [Streptomyces sp. NPDC015184]|uniref:hypothetical protein n=1 Tax=Streptomyces sp. NPDC015184 TaxID=3364946 RepID=UPI0036F86310
MGTGPLAPGRLRPAGPESLGARTEGMGHQLRGGNIRFTIYDLTGGSPVPAGVTTLLPDHGVRTAEFVIVLAPEALGRGWAARPPGSLLVTPST